MEILFYYNFTIIYYLGKQNIKANTLIYYGNKQPAYTLNECELFRHQTLLPPKYFSEINAIIITFNSIGLSFFDKIK